MKRNLRLQQPFLTHRFDVRSWAVELPITTSDVAPLVCEISLLLFGRSDQLSLLFDKGRKLIVSLVEDSSRIAGSKEGTMSLRLTRRDLEFIICFLLTWYRDGLAETNHIDIDLIGSSSIGEDCTLVLQAENSQPPLPGNEAERIIRKIP